MIIDLRRIEAGDGNRRKQRREQLGAGFGQSVLEVINAFSKACGKPVKYTFAPRRDGDLPAYWADPAKAEKELNWKVTRTLEDMANDTWLWQSKNPQGYPD